MGSVPVGTQWPCHGPRGRHPISGQRKGHDKKLSVRPQTFCVCPPPGSCLWLQRGWNAISSLGACAWGKGLALGRSGLALSGHQQSSPRLIWGRPVFSLHSPLLVQSGVVTGGLGLALWGGEAGPSRQQCVVTGPSSSRPGCQVKVQASLSRTRKTQARAASHTPSPRKLITS